MLLVPQISLCAVDGGCWRTDAGEHRSALLENVFALGGDADEGQLVHYAGVAARRYHEDKLGARVKVRAADRIQYAQFNEAMRKARDERTEKRLLIVIVRQSVRSVRSLTPPDLIAGISARFPNRNSTSVRSSRPGST